MNDYPRRSTSFGELTTTATSACAVERQARSPWTGRLLVLAVVIVAFASAVPAVWGWK
jgi:hypothetical protein